jgi:hypothetical protein
MESNGPSAVEHADAEETALAPSAEPGPAVDPLADAHCLHCGYSLRGLTQNRCPECGNPFDPDEMANSYLPEWPRLMVWFLTAACLTCLFQLLSRVLWALGSKTAMSSLVAGTQNFAELFESATTIVIAPFAIIGLMRKTDWGRKTAIGLFVVQAIPLVPVALYLAVRLGTVGPYDDLGAEMIFEIVPAWQLAGNVSLPALIIACVLCTRLRRWSLRRRQWDPPLLLPLNRFLPRGDWLLVLVVLLAAQAVGGLASMGTSTLWLIAVFKSTWFTDQERWKYLIHMAIWAVFSGVLSGWVVWVARSIWRNPAGTQKSLKSLLVAVAVCTIALLLIGMIVSPERYFFSSPASMVFNMSAAIIYLVGCVAAPYALYRYAAKVLPPEAITRVLKPQA